MKVFYNANIYNSHNRAFVEDEGKIIFIGNDEDALKYNGEHIDLNDKYVYPGFNDSHMHLVNYGQFLSRVSLVEHTSSLQDMLDELKKNLKKGKWLIGRGWNHDYFTDVSRFPTKQDLDKISKEEPIVITRTCGHVLVANSKAIELAHIDNKEVEGGAYNLETGLFEENATYLIYDIVPKPTIEDIKDYVLIAQKKLHSYGITSVQSDDLLSATSNYKDALIALEELSRDNQLTIRIYEQAQFLNLNDLKEFVENGYNTGKGNDFFKIGPLKMLGDGSLGARTALLSKPYYDDSSKIGIPVYTKEELNAMFDYAHKNDMQIAIHAIGDGILDWILEAYETILKKYPKDNHRHGVVHCQITRKDQLEKFKDMQLHAYVQPVFIDYDNHIVESRVDPETAKTSYNFKTLNNYTSMSSGSDCPVEYPDVLKGIQLAITRTSLDGTGPYLAEQALSVNEAIDSFTKQAAYASFEENIKGELKVGMLCDFVVLENSIEQTQVHEIKDIQILSTYVDGKEVYTK